MKWVPFVMWVLMGAVAGLLGWNLFLDSSSPTMFGLVVAIAFCAGMNAGMSAVQAIMHKRW